LQAENFQNASEVHGKYLRVWTQKSRKCAQNFFFDLQSENLKNAPKTFLLTLEADNSKNASELHGKQL